MSKIIETIIIFMVFVKVTSPIPFIPTMATTWIVLLLLMITYCISKGNFSIDKFLSAFIVFAVIGLMVMQPETYFKSWERLLGFVLNIALLSPLIKSETFDEVKKKLFSYTFVGLKIIMFASFVAYFFGVNLGDKYSREDNWAFSGITNQSMVLAPVCAICIIQAVWAMVTQKINKRYKWFCVMECLCGTWCIMVAGSRGSILGALAAIIFLFYKYGNYTKIAKYLLVVLITATLIPQHVIDKAFYTIDIKQENNAISVSDLTSTRDEKWNARIEEFLESPVFGCGFASQTHYTSDDIVWYIEETGGLEPGSSWLCILAMTGIIGFFTLGGLMIRVLIRVWKDGRANTNAIFFLALWLFFLLNGMMEGWIFYSGGFVFYLWWLLFGTTDACTRNNYEINMY